MTTLTTVETKVSEIIEAGNGTDISMVCTGMQIMTTSYSMGANSCSLTTDEVEQEIKQGKFDVFTKVNMLNEPIARLKAVKNTVQALMAKYGVRAEKLLGTYFVPKEVLGELLSALFEQKEKFENVISEIASEFEEIQESARKKLESIDNEEVKAKALSKIPTLEDFKDRNNFELSVYNLAEHSSDEELAKKLAKTAEDTRKKVLEAYKNKVFQPIYAIMVDIERNARNHTDYNPNDLGRKRGSLRRAIETIFDQKTAVELVIREGDNKDLVNNVYKELEVVYDCFAAPVNTQGLSEQLLVDAFYRIGETFRSQEAFEKYFNTENKIDLLNGIDLRIKGGLVTKSISLVTPEEALEEVTPEVSVFANFSELADILDGSTDDESVEIKAEESLSESTVESEDDLEAVFGSSLCSPKVVSDDSSKDEEIEQPKEKTSKVDIPPSFAEDLTPPREVKLDSAEDLYSALGLL